MPHTGKAAEVTATAVLASGGLDSAALLAETASTGVAHPIYVEAGMVWESGEKASLETIRWGPRQSQCSVRDLPVLTGGPPSGRTLERDGAGDSRFGCAGRRDVHPRPEHSADWTGGGMVQHSRCEPGGHRFARFQSVSGCNSRLLHFVLRRAE